MTSPKTDLCAAEGHAERTDLWRQQKEKGHGFLCDFFLCYTFYNTVLVISVTAPQSNKTTSLPFYSKTYTGNKQTNKTPQK